MAHADYECCCICDNKITYSSDALAKDVLCPDCAVDVSLKTGKRITSPEDLIGWIKETNGEIVVNTLKSLSFRFCYYSNQVDRLVFDLLGLEGYIPGGTSLKEVLEKGNKQ